MAENPDPFEQPRSIDGLDDCYFYHTMEIPGHGEVRGEWDLRGRAEGYLGDTCFAGKRVLDVGAASGYLSFEMERMGADVISFDLSDEHDWDIVPFDGSHYAERIAERRAHIRRLNNGYWLAHKANGSRARVVHGTVYAIPESIGEVDVAVFGSVLLHLRDPFLAMQNAARLTRETMVVADAYPRRYTHLRYLDRVTGPWMRLLPDWRKGGPYDGWWFLTPAIVRQFLGILGFTKTQTTFHWQTFRGSRRPTYTVVGDR